MPIDPDEIRSAHMDDTTTSVASDCRRPYDQRCDWIEALYDGVEAQELKTPKDTTWNA